jgi:competence ComEA-like helix-hairpin-helix protein
MKSQFVRGLFFSLALLSFTVAADAELPDGKGKDIVENTCTDCHSLERIKAQRRDEDGWTAIMREMIETGASINPDDMTVIVEYLAKNFGPDKKLNINKAAASEIAAVLQLTSAEADTIVGYRTRNGNFKNLSELEKVGGLADKIEAKKALIEF